MVINNIAGLAVFAKVVEQESFSHAATDLGVSKSAVSKQIAALEERLGARLLNRTTRRLSLTEAGARLFDRCQRIVAEVEAAEQEAGQLHSRPTGTLRVSAGMSFGHLHLAQALSGFLDTYPDLNVELVLNDRVVDLVEEGYDMALRIGKLEASSLIQRRLAPVRMFTVASPGYVRQRGAPRHPSELPEHDCISYSHARVAGGWPFTVPEGPTRIRIAPRIVINNGDAIARMVEADRGITQLPSFIVYEALRDGRLITVLDDFEPPPLGLYAVFPQSRNLSVKVRVFINFLARRFTGTPYWDQQLGQA